MGQEILRFPLFPLGLVLLPGETVPLHIFEERYKLMIGECLDEEREFGIIWVADDAALERARSGYADLVEEVTDSRPEAEALAEMGAYAMAATLEIAPAAKQALLELRSEPTRLEQLGALFAEALKRIKTAERVAEQASGNGHLKPGGDT